MSQEVVKKIQELVNSSELSQEKKQDLLIRLQALTMLNDSKDSKVATLLEILYQKAQVNINAVEEFFSGLNDFIISYVKEGQKGVREQLEVIEQQIPKV